MTSAGADAPAGRTPSSARKPTTRYNRTAVHKWSRFSVGAAISRPRGMIHNKKCPRAKPYCAADSPGAILFLDALPPGVSCLYARSRSGEVSGGRDARPYGGDGIFYHATYISDMAGFRVDQGIDPYGIKPNTPRRCCRSRRSRWGRRRCRSRRECRSSRHSRPAASPVPRARAWGRGSASGSRPACR